ncbi:cytochrome c-type biogenesis protein [Magnetococcales bacterium HHB-1]
MRTILCMLLILGSLSANLSHAKEVVENPTEATVREIAANLRCAVCQNQSIYESNSDLAKDMLAVIRKKVAAGENQEEIQNYFFTRYGDYIYLEPTTRGVNLLIWWAPFIALGGGIYFLVLTFYRRKKEQRVTPQEETVSSVAQEDKIQQALKDVKI